MVGVPNRVTKYLKIKPDDLSVFFEIGQKRKTNNEPPINSTRHQFQCVLCAALQQRYGPPSGR